MIYLIRHGQAAASWGDHPDPGLSDLGRTQAKTVAASLSGLGLAHAFTSPMARCQETGSFFADLSGLGLRVEPHVTEIPTPAEVDDRVAWLRSLMSGDWSAAPGVVADWKANLLSSLNALPDQSVVFTHFVAINAVVGALEGTDQVTVFRPNYCSITKIERTPDGLRLIERGESLETKVL